MVGIHMKKEVEEVHVLINTVDMSLIKRRYGSSSSSHTLQWVTQDSKDLMTPAWNNNGFSQGTGSAAFLTGKNEIYEVVWLQVSWVLDLVTHQQVFVLTCTTLLMTLLLLEALLECNGSVTNVKRYRGLVMGPGNALYACTDEGEVWKITASLK